MRFLIAIGSSLVASSLICAQHVIDLSEVTLDLPHMGIAVDSVFIAFPADRPIGEVVKGAYKRREPVKLQLPVDESLFELLQRSLPTDSVRFSTVIKVNELRMEEHSLRGADVSLCSVHIEFLARDKDGICRVYDHGSSRSALSASATRLDELLIETLEECFIGCWSAITQDRMRKDPTRFTATPTPVALLDLPIMNAQARRRGIYRNFQDFRYNIPDTSVLFEIKELTRSGDPVRRAKLLDAGSGSWGSIWGFSDGQVDFLNAGSYFVEVKHENDLFKTYLWASEPMNAGALLDGSLMTGQTQVYGWVEVEQTYIVDPLSGRLSIYPEHGSGTMTGNTPRSRHVFGYSMHSSLDANVCLYVYGSLEACIGKGQHYDYKPVRRNEFMTIELRIDEGSSVKLDLDTNAPQEQYVLIKVDAKGGITADIVNAQMAMSLLSDLDPAMEVKPSAK